MREKANVDRFNADVEANEGYLYTSDARLSSVLANQRLSAAVSEMVSLEGRKVLDVGCGDGAFTHDLFLRCRPASMVGVDAAAGAVELARKKYSDAEGRLRFDTASVYKMPYEPASYDVAIVRGVLHHLSDPALAISKVSELAAEVMVIEPNGYNPILKLIERFSPYHLDHEERSFFPSQLRQWVADAGGVLEQSEYAGLVPFFCPDWMARGLKAIEPIVEGLPGARQLSCAVYAFRFRSACAQKSKTG